MGHAEDLANGVQLARDATLAQLGNEPDRVVELLNASTPPELAHAVVYLVERYQEVLVTLSEGDRIRAADGFRRAMADDVADELARGELAPEEPRP